MKKILFAMLAIAAALSLASCVQDVADNGDNGAKLDSDNAIAFTLASQIATRSAEECVPVQGASVSLGEPVLGENITLEETVLSLDGLCQEETPETRGTPVYTGNFFEMTGGAFKGLAYKVGEMDTPFISDGSIVWDDYFQKWVRYFVEDPWGDETQLLFFARVAKDNASGTQSQPVGVVYDSYRYLYDATNGQSMTFSYRSPFKAQDQQDILFACRTIDKSQTNSGIPLLFYHALTGVKFATAHANNDDTKTYIDKVEFTGLYGYGKCKIVPTMENGQYADVAGTYSSESAVTWDISFNGVNSATAVYSQEFGETAVDYAADGSFSSKGEYPSSFSSAGNEKNLNDSDGSMTFWLVPQAMTDAVKLKVTFRIVKGTRSETFTRVVNFGEQLSGVEWKAGELRTYTLKANAVDIDITDSVTGFEKSDVVITNTGNVNAYIRAQIVANWIGKMGTAENSPEGVALGYTTADGNVFCEAWAINADLSGDNYHGVFTRLPGSGWVYAKDGCFYYKLAVAPGEETGSKLFESYSLDTGTYSVPRVWYLDPQGGRKEFQDVYLQMEIPVQAIEAKSDYADYKEAWAAAGVPAEVFE